MLNFTTSPPLTLDGRTKQTANNLATRPLRDASPSPISTVVLLGALGAGIFGIIKLYSKG